MTRHTQHQAPLVATAPEHRRTLLPLFPLQLLQAKMMLHFCLLHQIAQGCLLQLL